MGPGTHRIAAAVLAGGQSRRMGQPKALLPLDGKPLVEHLIALLKQELKQEYPGHDNTVLVSGCPEPGLYRHLSVPVLSDVMADCGPLGGLYTALRHVSQLQGSGPVDALLCVPCDGARLPPHFVARMVAALGHRELVYARDSEQEQPLYCLVRCSRQGFLSQDLLAYLNGGGRKVIDWFHSRDYAVVEFVQNGFVFPNLNTPDDWRRFS